MNTGGSNKSNIKVSNNISGLGFQGGGSVNSDKPKSVEKKSYVFRRLADKLRAAGCIWGFSGSNCKDTLLAIGNQTGDESIDMCFTNLTITELISKGNHIIENAKMSIKDWTYDPECKVEGEAFSGESVRSLQIAKQVLDSERYKTCPIIIIDEFVPTDFDPTNSKYNLYNIIKEKITGDAVKIIVLTDWSRMSYTMTNTLLDDKRYWEKNLIVITNVEGSRGIDYAFGKESFVILAFNPIDWQTYYQAISRGSRKAHTNAKGWIIANK